MTPYPGVSSDGNGGLTVAGSVAVGTTVLEKDGVNSVNVQAKGADSTGVTDSTAAITAAINTATTLGVGIYFPHGTYTITPTLPGSYAALFPTLNNTRIYGDGEGVSVIKVKAGSGDYYTLFEVGSNVTIEHLTIDQNSANNPQSSSANAAAHPRVVFSWYLGAGSNFSMDHVTVLNIDDINVVYGNATNTKITNCSFIFTNGAYAHDHSTLYLAADGATVTGNYFYASGIQQNGVGTAIETHGGHMTVTGNVIVNLASGMNITGVTGTDSDTSIVSGNTIFGAGFGVTLWSMQYAGHTTGYGLDNLIVANNSIHISQASYTGTIGTFGGIIFDPSNNLPVRNVRIEGNEIAFDQETVANPPTNTVNLGIGSVIAASSYFDGLSIVNNTVANAPMYAIAVTTPGTNLLIQGNRIINPGQSLDSGVNSVYRVGVWLASAAQVGNLRVLNNVITDNLSTTRAQNCFGSYAGQVGDFIFRGNTCSVTGTTTTAFTGAYNFSTNTQLPLIDDTVLAPAGLSLPTKQVANGSTIRSLTNGVLYNVAADGVTWQNPQTTLPPFGGLSSDGLAGYGPNENVLLYSESFTTSPWFAGNSTVTPNSTTNPFGASTASTLTEDTSTGGHYVTQSVTLTAQPYTVSIYAKGNGDNLLIQTDNGFASFDLTAGVVHSFGFGGTGAILSLGGGWYRCSVTTGTQTAGSHQIFYYLANSSFANSYTGNGTSGVYLWGAQVNSGTTIFSYKQTAGTAFPLTNGFLFAPTITAQTQFVGPGTGLTGTAASLSIGGNAATATSAASATSSATAANLSGAPTLPNGTSATTQSAGDNTTKLATDAYVDRVWSVQYLAASSSPAASNTVVVFGLAHNIGPFASSSASVLPVYTPDRTCTLTTVEICQYVATTLNTAAESMTFNVAVGGNGTGLGSAFSDTQITLATNSPRLHCAKVTTSDTLTTGSPYLVQATGPASWTTPPTGVYWYARLVCR
jgi:hypothetical protein